MPKYTKGTVKGARITHKVIQDVRQRRAYGLPGELALDADFYKVPAAAASLAPVADVVLDTIELKGTESEAVSLAKKARVQCREVAFLLNRRSNIQNLECSLHKAAKKIENCAIWGAYQSLSDDVNYKIGTAFCKSRLCPNCQRVLSAKRKANYLDWAAVPENAAVLKRYNFYHLVLTVKHDAVDGIRNNLYTSDLLRYFKRLRGSDKTFPGWRATRDWWEEKVAGGVYSTEIKAGRDGSPHIHIHVLLIAKGLLWNRIKESEFKLRARTEWAAITGDTMNGVFIDPVYYVTENGTRINCHIGASHNVERGVAECMKYTLKSDAASLQNYSDAFLNELLTFRNRYYGRFGILSPKHPDSKKLTRLDMLCTDYKDLEQMTRAEAARLFDPESGEVVPVEQTKIVLTPARNMKANSAPVVVDLRAEQGEALATTRGLAPLGGDTYFSLLDASPGALVRYEYTERQRASLTLARSLKRVYDPKTDL